MSEQELWGQFFLYLVLPALGLVAFCVWTFRADQKMLKLEEEEQEKHDNFKRPTRYLSSGR